MPLDPRRCQHVSPADEEGHPGAVSVDADEAARRFGRALTRDDVHDGQVLTLRELDRLVGPVSEFALRAAVRTLADDGLVTVTRTPQLEVRITAPSAARAARSTELLLQQRGTTLLDLFTASAMLEGPCAATTPPTPKVISRLRALVDAEDAVRHDPRLLLAAQTRFHDAVVAFADNATIGLMSSMLRPATVAACDAVVGGSPWVSTQARVASRAHRRLVDLIATGYTAEAAALWRRHIEQTGAHVVAESPARTVADLLGTAALTH